MMNWPMQQWSPKTKKPKIKITKRSPSAHNLFLKYNIVIQASSYTLDDIPMSSFGLEDVEIGTLPWLMMAPDEEIAAYRKKVIRRALNDPPSKDGASTFLRHSDKPITLSEQDSLILNL